MVKIKGEMVDENGGRWEIKGKPNGLIEPRTFQKTRIVWKRVKSNQQSSSLQISQFLFQ